MIDKEHVCYERKRREIRKKDINRLFGNAFLKRMKIERFLKQEKTTASVIPVEELWKHEVALFQNNQDNPFEELRQEYSLNDILVDYVADYEFKFVRAQKLFYWSDKYILETRVYRLENYNKTWRAWTALPTREKAREWK